MRAAALLLLLAGCTTMEKVDALMKDYDGNVPGASVLVVRDGRALVRSSYGFADLEGRVRATPETNYRLASLTKQFTARAILILARDGRLQLDDPVRRWLPSLPQPGITIRHLLTHTSGLLDYEDLIPPGTTAQLHDADVLRLLEPQTRTKFAPGSQYDYSNSGYALLALIVERASGLRFAEFLQQRIFEPLGMRTTVAFEEGMPRVANRAFGYSRTDDGWTRTDQSLTSAVLGDGGIYASIDDLQKWDAALYDESFRDALLPHTQTNDPDVQYGYGLRISGETVCHSGETIGFRNVIVRYPRRRLTVVILTNRNAPPPYPAALAIAKLFQ